MTTNDLKPDEILEFIRKRNYNYVRTIGQGACGQTILLHDPTIELDFVCKKYLPFNDDVKQDFFNRFVQEIKHLYETNHENIVRIFAHYLYPKQSSGYIVMEFIDGMHIHEFIARHPKAINKVFIQVINGFTHLENIGILHRDIRKENIMVTNNGQVKIIDFGFAKIPEQVKDFQKSISLNAWCSSPKEYENSTYDCCTEVYFIGELFSTFINPEVEEFFKYQDVLEQMKRYDPKKRIKCFTDLQIKMTRKAKPTDFTNDQLEVYRAFVEELLKSLCNVTKPVDFINDPLEVLKKLEESYTKFCLAETVPDNTEIFNAIISGLGYRYYATSSISVEIVKNFITLLRNASGEQQKIILSNIHKRLEQLESIESADEDDIPF